MDPACKAELADVHDLYQSKIILTPVKEDLQKRIATKYYGSGPALGALMCGC